MGPANAWTVERLKAHVDAKIKCKTGGVPLGRSDTKLKRELRSTDQTALKLKLN